MEIFVNPVTGYGTEYYTRIIENMAEMNPVSEINSPKKIGYESCIANDFKVKYNRMQRK